VVAAPEKDIRFVVEKFLNKIVLGDFKELVMSGKEQIDIYYE